VAAVVVLTFSPEERSKRRAARVVQELSCFRILRRILNSQQLAVV
jgi:hypothetical protein